MLTRNAKLTTPRSTLRSTSLLLLAIGLAFASGCDADWQWWRSRTELTAWVADEMSCLTDRTPAPERCEIVDPETGEVKLFAAANETVSFQLVIDSHDERVEKLTVSSASLLGGQRREIPADNIRAFRMLPVKVAGFPSWYLRLVPEIPEPANFYDALVPVDLPEAGQPFSLAPGERLALWIDVHVPRRTPPGLYRGELELSSRSHERRRVKLSMEVYDFVLPDARPLAAVGGFDYRTLFAALIQRDGKPFQPSRLDRRNPLVREGLVRLRELMTLAHEHRLDLFDRGICPVIKRDEMGKVHLDWTDYDAVVRPYLDGSAFADRIGCPGWPVPFSSEWPNVEHYGGYHSEEYAATAAAAVSACAEHFRAIGVDEQMFAWCRRGEVSAGAFDLYMLLARFVRSADPDVPILTRLPANPPKLTGWRPPDGFASLVDIHAPAAHWLSLAEAGRLARPEHPLTGAWLSPGRPPYLPSLGVIATAADARALAWFAMKYKCTGIFLPEVLNWNPGMLDAPAGADTRLFYPGTIAGAKCVLPSVRLKRLRRGLLDITYLWILQQRRRGTLASAITNSLARYAGLEAVGDHYLDPRLGGWVQHAGTWRMARRLMAEEVEAAVRPEQMSTSRLTEYRLAWKRLDQRTHSIRVEQARCRVSPIVEGEAADRKITRLRATFLLDLYNEYNRSTDVQVALEALPDGWKAVESGVRLSPFARGAGATVRLVAEGTHLPTDGKGSSEVGVSITVDMQQRQEVAVRLPFVAAAPATTPPKIDGRLDDWPIRLANTAGDFRLIGRRGEIGDGLARRQTLVFVLQDAENLYLAFRCDEPDPSAMKALASNVVRYEQLMACGEDLVEVLLDPGAAGKGPEDLYHVVVKPGGAVITEKGISTYPPLGKSGPWSANVKAAADIQDKLWVVEMAIPRAAFGEAGKAELWGVNFTRFAFQGQEASSWSGAARYFYDPRNLGTMFIPPVEQAR